MLSALPWVIHRVPRPGSSVRLVVASLGALCVACARPSQPAVDANAAIDSLNARIVDTYRRADPRAYAALYTDTAVFEWPAFNTVRGPAALEAMARSNWAGLKDMDLRLTVSHRRVTADHATEFGAFEQSWTDSAGGRMTEYGRYAELLVREPNGWWRIDHFLGFEDSTRRGPARPRRVSASVSDSLVRLSEGLASTIERRSPRITLIRTDTACSAHMPQRRSRVNSCRSA